MLPKIVPSLIFKLEKKFKKKNPERTQRGNILHISRRKGKELHLLISETVNHVGKKRVEQNT